MPLDADWADTSKLRVCAIAGAAKATHATAAADPISARSARLSISSPMIYPLLASYMDLQGLDAHE